MDGFWLIWVVLFLFLGFKECDQQDFEHKMEMKKQEFKLDSLKAANQK